MANEIQVLKFTLNDVEYTLKMTSRVVIVFEQITERQFNNSTLDNMILVYSMFIAYNDHFEMDFDKFVDWMDEHVNEYVMLMKFVKGVLDEPIKEDGNKQ